MHQFGWLSERGGNFVNLLQKEGVPRKGGGPNLEETMANQSTVCKTRTLF